MAYHFSQLVDERLKNMGCDVRKTTYQAGRERERETETHTQRERERERFEPVTLLNHSSVCSSEQKSF